MASPYSVCIVARPDGGMRQRLEYLHEEGPLEFPPPLWSARRFPKNYGGDGMSVCLRCGRPAAGQYCESNFEASLGTFFPCASFGNCTGEIKQPPPPAIGKTSFSLSMQYYSTTRRELLLLAGNKEMEKLPLIPSSSVDFLGSRPIEGGKELSSSSSIYFLLRLLFAAASAAH